MKNYIFPRPFLFSLMGATLIVFSGCQPEEPEPTPPTQSTTMQWNATINGQTYSWQSTFTEGSYPTNSNNSGSSSAVTSTTTPFSLTGVKDDGTQRSLQISLPTYATGTYTVTSSNYNGQTNTVNFIENGSPNYSTGYGGSITVNVTACPTTIYGVVKCTFSGTIGRSPSLGGGTVSISGSFDAVKMN
jgi:hypothetical protein